MAKDNWTPDYDELKDILRPMDEANETPPPQNNGLRLKESEREWIVKREAEDRRQQITGRKTRLWARLSQPFQRKEKSEKQKQQRPREALAFQAPAVAQIVPYAAILLLVPFVGGPVVSYLLVLFVTAVPLALAALRLRPLGPRAWLFRMVAPLLPMEAWFALRYGQWNPAGALTWMGLGVLAGLLYYAFAVRDKERGKPSRPVLVDNPKIPLEQRIEARRQARWDRGEGGKEADKSHSHRLLLFVTLLAAASLLIPAALGLDLALRRPNPNEVLPLETQSLEDDALMTRRMISAFGQLQPDPWGRSSRQDKLQALQALLDVETDEMGLKQRFSLRDPRVFTAVSGAGHTSLAAALLSSRASAELRARAMCHLAYHLKQLTISEHVNMRWFEEEARGYEDARYIVYAGKWENREAENDHVQ